MSICSIRHIYESLKKLNLHKNENLVIIQFSWGTFQIDNNREFINGGNNKVTSAAHFAISTDGGKTIWDSEGEVDIDLHNYHLIVPNKMIERFCKASLVEGDWNSNFRREIAIPQINELLQINLPILEN